MNMFYHDEDELNYQEQLLNHSQDQQSMSSNVESDDEYCTFSGYGIFSEKWIGMSNLLREPWFMRSEAENIQGEDK